MLKAIKSEINILFHKKQAKFIYVVMLIWVLVNYYYNIKTYHGLNIYLMYDLRKLIFLGELQEMSYYFAQIVPFLIAIPAAMIFVEDTNSREHIFIQTRIGKKKYFASQGIAVFIVSGITFIIPMYIELILNFIAFPAKAIGDPSGVSEIMGGIDANMYFFSSIWKYNKTLYCIFYIALVGGIIGALALFTYSLSALLKIKFKIFLLIPIYALVYLIAEFGSWFECKYETNYFFYFRMYSKGEYSEKGFVIAISLIMLVSIIFIVIRGRKDNFG